MITHITDHVDEGVARLTERYRQPHISALLASWLSEVQAAEDALWQLLTERAVDNAVGRQLDILGRIVGQPREGRSDDVYRVWVAARMLVSRSSGLPEQLIAITRKLVSVSAGGGAVVRVRLEELYPAAVTMHVDGAIDGPTGIQIARLLALAKAAGVAVHFEWFFGAVDDVFTFAPADVSVFDIRGFETGVLSAVSDGGDVELYIEPADGLLDDTDGSVLLDDTDGDFLIYG